jgi:CBS domain-containing protein
MAVREETRGVAGQSFRATVRAIPARDAAALAIAVVFLGLGFAAIYVAATVANVKGDAVLAALLLLPAILYLLLSGRVSEFKGPAGLEVKLTQVANSTIPMHSGEEEAALAYERVQEVGRERTESFLQRIRALTPDDPVVFTLKLGSGPINGAAAADYAKGLTQFPRFRFVAIIDQRNKLVSYMEERAFRHVIESDAVDAQTLLNNVQHANVRAVRAYPGMIKTTVCPTSSIADALREMEDARKDALLVAENGEIKGIVERDRLANALLLTLLEYVQSRES